MITHITNVIIAPTAAEDAHLHPHIFMFITAQILWHSFQGPFWVSGTKKIQITFTIKNYNKNNVLNYFSVDA